MEYPALREKMKDQFSEEYGELMSYRKYLGEPLIKPASETYAVLGTGGRRPDLVVIEEKGSGLSLLQDMSDEGIPLFAYNPGREDKVARAKTISHLTKAKLVLLREDPENPGRPDRAGRKFLQRVVPFRSGVRRDDVVDTLSQGLAVLRDMRYLRVELKLVKPRVEQPRERINPYAG